MNTIKTTLKPCKNQLEIIEDNKGLTKLQAKVIKGFCRNPYTKGVPTKGTLQEINGDVSETSTFNFSLPKGIKANICVYADGTFIPSFRIKLDSFRYLVV